MRKLGALNHDECAPWCDHDPAHHAEDCAESFCDGYACQRKPVYLEDPSLSHYCNWRTILDGNEESL